MIFKVKFSDDRTDWCQAKSEEHVRKSYEEEEGVSDQIVSIQEISEEEAKTIMLTNTDYDETDPHDAKEISVYDMVCGEDFAVVGSSEYL
jgi:hypothetical protein